MSLSEDVQEYLESIEDYIYVSFSSARAEMPNIQEALNRLWADVSRFGPAIPEIRLPVLIEVPPPPPPPPPPPSSSIFGNVMDWVAENPWKASSVVGVGLLVGYNAYRARTQGRLHKSPHTTNHERRQVVVVLGADDPLALPLILALEKKGFIIIASVASPEAVDELERAGKGYVKALVLDPFEPATIPIFLRSLASTLSHRFPINIHGDPHASPATHPFVHSVVSLLGLSQFSTLAPMEHVQLQSDYLEYLNATHVTPLQIIQALLPLMRNSPSRTRDAIRNGKGKKSIVVCIRAQDADIGFPFRGPSSISATANRRAVEVLRREVRVAASTGSAEGMSDIEVASLEVGVLEIPPFDGRRKLNYDLKEYIKCWTPSEKLAYKPAWELTLEGSSRKCKRSKVDHFVDDLVQIVSYGRVCYVSFCGLRLHVGSALGWLRGGRYAVGSGVVETSIYSHLPGALLDALINFPFYFISTAQKIFDEIRASRSASASASAPAPASSPISPSATSRELPPVPAPAPASASRPLPPRPLPTPPIASAPVPAPATVAVAVAKETVDSAPSSEHEHGASENGSEADVESNDGAGVSESWVSLQPNPTMASSETITA